MSSIFISLLSATTIISICQNIVAIKLPENIKRCSKKDPINLASCLKITIIESTMKLANGNPSLGVPKLEPVSAPFIDFGASTGKILHAQKQIYKNIIVDGITNHTIEQIEADFNGDKCYWKYVTKTPYQLLKANYEMKGTILNVPFDGNGKASITSYDQFGTHHMQCKRNGTHLVITKYEFTIRLTRIRFYYENLIPGNLKQSEELLENINKHSIDLFDDLNRLFAEAFKQVWMGTLSNIFNNVPEDDLFLSN